ncbi:MAG: prolyl oligopeptidase family serine peptidase [Byssovorax sp.]
MALDPSVPRLLPPPPPTRRDEVVDTLHGKPIADPYRWLEDGRSPEVRAWSAAQTARTESVLKDLPEYAEIRGRLEALLTIGTVEAPHPVTGADGVVRYFYRRQGPGQDQPVLFVREGLHGADRALIDPNLMSADRTTSLDWWSPSWDGGLLAYGLSEGGDENSTLRVLDVTTGRDLGPTEVITRARYASIAWLPDASGFYYSRFPEKGSVPPGEEAYHKRIYEHRLGRDAGEDPLVFGAGRPMTDTPSVEISPNGRWLVASVHRGWSRRELHILDRAAVGEPRWIPVATPQDDAIYEATTLDDHLLVRTNDAAPMYRLFRVDLDGSSATVVAPRARWREIIPTSKDVLAQVSAVGGDVFAVFIVDARSVVRRYRADGTPKGEIPLPTLGTVPDVLGEWNGSEAFFGFTSFAVPAMVFRIDLISGQSALWAEVKPPIDPAEFVVTQERAPSRDGTSIPMFVSHRRGLARDGSAPALLGGYGGFNISQMPAWSGARYAFLERGGVAVTANLRGGGEYGEAWHRAGMLARKQNVFDDLFAVADELVRSGATSPERLAVLGGSNGGLLVGAAITQRPDLFRAAVCMVPLLDMIRYHRFLIARLWIPEYGSADNPEQFGWLEAYSPYHQVKPGVRYPAVLFSTAEGDTRVDPLHARKMAALLQAESGSDRPVLLRIESRAGHGAGKPISKRVDESSLIYTFLLWQLGRAR